MAEETPLDVMQSVMRKALEAGDMVKALAAARAAAPYVHGRAPLARGAGDLAEVPDDELGEWGGSGAEASAENPG